MTNNNESTATDKTQSTSPFGQSNLTAAAVIISIIMGTAFSLLVMKDFIGINLFLFSLIAIGGVGIILYKDENLDIKNYAFFAGTFLIYASIFFRLKQEVFTVLTFPVLIGLIVITTIFSSKTGAAKNITTFLYRLFGPIARVDKLFTGVSHLNKKGKQISAKHRQILAGILISMIMLFMVIPLMMSAEAAFDTFIQDILEKIQWDFDFREFMWKMIAGVAVAIIFCGFLYTFTTDKKAGTKDKSKAAAKEDNHALIITVLSIMGLVFLVFAVVQFNSLFVSKAAIAKTSTFAKTARDGYFQLVVLSVINFIMVLTFTRMQTGSNKITKNVIKGLTTYFTALNVYLLVSSAYKMTLYYNAYGLSVERLLVYILLVFELIALVLLLIKIYKSHMPFIKIMIYYTVAFWAVVSLINIEAWVMQVNVNRYEETGEIDIDYICWLSDDASNEIKDLYFDHYDDLSEEQKHKIAERFYYNSFNSFRDYPEFYENAVEIYKENARMDSWLEFNISHYRKYNDGIEVLEDYVNKN